jgi:DNA-directed RNA polymerase specialized sigma24 family protein
VQPPTEPTPAAPQHSAPRGDEDELYRRHHRELHRAVAHIVRAPRELIEDACQTAWAILLRCQPDRYAVFAWLRVVAVHEAYRLSAIDRRDARLERLRPQDGNWHDITADPRSLEDAIEALEALRVVASLPERQRRDFVLKLAGYSYEEIRLLTPGRTATNLNKSLVKARARIRAIHPRDCLTWPPSIDTGERGGQFTPSSLLWSEMAQSTPNAESTR